MRFRYQQPFLRMSESGGAGAAAAGGTPAAGGSQQQQHQPAPGVTIITGPPHSGTEDPAVLRKQLDDARAEAASSRIRARDTQEALEKAQAEQQRIQAEVDAKIAAAVTPLNTRLTKVQERTRSAEIKVAAQAAGIKDMDLLPLLASMPNAPKIEVNDDGEVTGTTEAIAAFKVWKPEFFGTQGAGSGGAGGGSGQGGAAAGGSGGGASGASGGNQSGTRSSGAGGTPPPAGGNAPVDARTISKADYPKWKADQLKSLRPALR